ncbi:ROK family protein [Cyclobacterium sp.]|uniref:ROK family protein n=1 Tax=Cyclobacterium sp. TaxID=1966343 RepID=UPI0019AB6AB1|nr:ROK family protein [Cyclobacterium sp.]MBD3627524.1 ROK family protein [Cyclobacterium sp.]
MKASNTVLGMDIGGTKISSGIIRDGKIAERIQSQTPASLPQEEILDAISLQISAYKKFDFQAIGIGIPGLVDPIKGIVYNLANIPSFQKVNLKSYLENKFKVPVVVNNDANCFALGEYKFGPALSHRHVVGITLGTGIGTGIIANGHLYTGQLCGAGEWGAVPYLDQTFEDYCSSKFFKNQYRYSAKKLSAKAKEGNPEALQIFNEYGQHLGQLIYRLLLTYAPEAIVIGGSIRKAYPYFEKGMQAIINEFPYKPISGNLKIYVSELDDSAILGAISLVEENEFLVKSENQSAPRPSLA